MATRKKSIQKRVELPTFNDSFGIKFNTQLFPNLDTELNYELFDQTFSDLLVVPNEFYFEELYFWIHEVLDGKINLEQPTIQKDSYSLYEKRGASQKFIVEFEFENFRMEDIFLNNDIYQYNPPHLSSPHQIFIITILNRIKRSPDDFIQFYLNHDKTLESEITLNDTILDKYEHVLKSIEVTSILSYGLNSRFFHRHDHGLIMSRDVRKLDNIDIKGKPKYFCEFYFSKESSQNFLVQVLSILKQRKEALLSRNNNFSKAIENDDRIDCGIDVDTNSIRKDFLKLTHEKELGGLILTETELQDLLQANFIGFGPKIEKKKIDARTDQGILIYFFNLIHKKYFKTKYKQGVFRKLITENFNNCNNLLPSTLRSVFNHMPESYPEYLIILDLKKKLNS